jgi:hypothetical protein
MWGGVVLLYSTVYLAAGGLAWDSLTVNPMGRPPMTAPSPVNRVLLDREVRQAGHVRAAVSPCPYRHPHNIIKKQI